MSERDKELSLTQHLGEFRDRLMVASISVIITTAISFVFTTEIIKLLILPAGEGLRLASFSPTENFTTYMRVALFTGIALAMPVLLYEIYAYIDPALHPHERRFAITLGPFILLLFAAGMSFCYFLVLPSALKFLLGFASDVFDNQLRASEYIGFVTTFILGMGIVFEMPVLIYALIRVGAVSRSWLAKQRRYFFLISFVVAAVVTPTPDPFNQSIVAIPIYLLFELGLFLGRFGGRRAAPST
ncbi:MAG: twin-arginine translocase subunit TatC [Chloroflexota bacterium]